MTKFQKRPRKIKPIKAWAGVVRGKIHGWKTQEAPYYEIYYRRADAKEHYQHFIRVKIVSLPTSLRNQP